MAKNRIRELRKSHGLTQIELGLKLRVSQQTISKIETDTSDVPIDLLIKLADYFKVTTDYILEISDIKRDSQWIERRDYEIDKYYDVVLRYKSLNEKDKKTVDVVLEHLADTQTENRNRLQKYIAAAKEDHYDESEHI